MESTGGRPGPEMGAFPVVAGASQGEEEEPWMVVEGERWLESKDRIVFVAAGFRSFDAIVHHLSRTPYSLPSGTAVPIYP